MSEIKGKIKLQKEICTGCLACMVACIDAHFQEGDTGALSMRRIQKITEEEAQFQKNICTGCLHCGLCIRQCAQGALYRDEETGFVLIHRDLCNGCGTCAKVCPEHVIFFDKDHKALKCDGCIGYRKERRLPACVKACGIRALRME